MIRKALVFFLVVLSNSAMAKHNYGSDDCIAKTIKGETIAISLLGPYAFGPHRLVTTSDSDEVPLWVNLDQSQGSPDMSTKESALVLKILNETKLESENTSDGCFQSTTSTASRSAIVLMATKKVEDLYGVRIGQKLVFSCYEDFSTPSGDECEQ